MNYTCPRRMTEWGPWEHTEGLDTWDTKRNGMRWKKNQPLCSFDGSAHPQDLLDGIHDHTITIEPTDKPYKFYVATNNSHMEAKFYTHHFTEEQGWEFHQLWKEHKITWGYPGAPYTRLYIPGPSGAAPDDPRL